MFATFQINKITFSLVAEKYTTRYTNILVPIILLCNNSV